MTRIKRGTIKNKRHKKVLKEARGYRGSRSRTFKSAKQQLMKSLSYSYRDRKNNKRNFRRLWITRINAAARINGLSYNLVSVFFKTESETSISWKGTRAMVFTRWESLFLNPGPPHPGFDSGIGQLPASLPAVNE